MSHIILLKVTKFQQSLLITLQVADEKPEGQKVCLFDHVLAKHSSINWLPWKQ